MSNIDHYFGQVKAKFGKAKNFKGIRGEPPGEAAMEWSKKVCKLKNRVQYNPLLTH